MILHVIASGSSGNCYALEAANSTLIIECGVKLQTVKERLGFNMSKVAGCVITHEHKDHCGCVYDFVRNGITSFVSKQTHKALGFNSHRLKVLEPHPFEQQIGEFRVQAFPVRHDVPCVGFIIWHEESGKTLFITDTIYSKYTFPGLNNIIVEANYCEDIIAQRKHAGTINGFVHDRVIGSHMSIQTACDLLRANDTTHVRNVVLCHLSDSNSNAKDFVIKAREALQGDHKTVYTASPGLSIPFNKTPF